MKKTNLYLTMALLFMALTFTSFIAKSEHKGKLITSYAWFTPTGQFVTWGNLTSVEATSGTSTNPTNGTLALESYTAETANGQPAGTLVYKLYSHP